MKNLKTWHWALIITLAVLLLLAVGVGIWWTVMDVETFPEGWALIRNTVDPPENDIHYKNSYSVSDKKAVKWADKVVATVGEESLTNRQLQVYYWMEVYTYLQYNGYYALGKGLDLAVPLDQQNCPDFEGTWQQYLLDMALRSWHEEQSLALVAQENGVKLSAEAQKELDGLAQELAASAVEDGFTSVDALLRHDMGAGCTYADYYSYRHTYALANAWFSERGDATLAGIGTEELERYFADHEQELARDGITKDSGLVYAVRHILVQPEDGTEDDQGNVTYSEESWAACEQKAQKLLDQWQDEGGTEELFSQYANKHSADPGSNTSGGLYEGMTADMDLLEEFVQWYSDESRRIGDYGLVKTQQGYHIMYLSDMEPEWESACREALLGEASKALMDQAMDKYPMEVDYKTIVLSVVDLQDVL